MMELFFILDTLSKLTAYGEVGRFPVQFYPIDCGAKDSDMVISVHISNHGVL